MYIEARLVATSERAAARDPTSPRPRALAGPLRIPFRPNPAYVVLFGGRNRTAEGAPHEDSDQDGEA